MFLSDSSNRDNHTQGVILTTTELKCCYFLAVYLSADHAAILLIQEDVEQRAPQTSADVLTAGTQSLASAGHRGQGCT